MCAPERVLAAARCGKSEGKRARPVGQLAAALSRQSDKLCGRPRPLAVTLHSAVKEGRNRENSKATTKTVQLTGRTYSHEYLGARKKAGGVPSRSFNQGDLPSLVGLEIGLPCSDVLLFLVLSGALGTWLPSI
jgi:hypothetical protein